MADKIRIKSNVRINAYEAVVRAVEEGVAYGYQRAFKHTDSPSEEQIKDEIGVAVTNALCEVLIFDEG